MCYFAFIVYSVLFVDVVRWPAWWGIASSGSLPHCHFCCSLHYCVCVVLWQIKFSLSLSLSLSSNQVSSANYLLNKIYIIFQLLEHPPHSSRLPTRICLWLIQPSYNSVKRAAQAKPIVQNNSRRSVSRIAVRTTELRLCVSH